MTSYFSYGEQTLHYFDRPHSGPAPGPIRSAAAWKSNDFSSRAQWCEQWNDDECAELLRALENALATGKPTGELTAADFPLPTQASKVAAWRDTLMHGRGFQVVSGLPVEDLSDDEAGVLFWCLGLHLGRPGAQNAKGDLLGHVTDTGEDASDPYVRLYKTRSAIAYHCDAADVVGLLCLRNARTGGSSRIASSVSVYNEILRRRPDLAGRLYEPFLLDIRNEASSRDLRYVEVPPCRYSGGDLRTFYHSDYFRSVVRHDDVEPLGERETELLDLYEEIAADPDWCVEMNLAPGEIQWLCNHTIVHARTAYEDGRADGGRRHLLRLWLSIERS